MLSYGGLSARLLLCTALLTPVSSIGSPSSGIGTGAGFQQKCRSVANGLMDEMYEVGECLAFLEGFNAGWHALTDALIESKATVKPHTIFCPPRSVTNGQMIKVAMKYLDDNPAQLHLRMRVLFRRALISAFPC